MYQSLFFNKGAGVRSVNFAKFLRTAFLQNTSRGLLQQKPNFNNLDDHESKKTLSSTLIFFKNLY